MTISQCEIRGIRFLCPNCRGSLRDHEAGCVCDRCGESFGFRDGTPVLIWPRTDTSTEDIIYSGGTATERRSLLARAYRLFMHRVSEVGVREAAVMVPGWITAQMRNRTLTLQARLGAGKRVRCPCCSWSGPAFGTYWDPSEVIRGFECPSCSSHPRHRFMALHLREWLELGSGVVLHLAPEPALEGVFQGHPGGDLRLTTDYAMAGVDCLTNLCRLPFAEDTFTGILCSHVLEHIEDDAAAIGEMFRVLRPGGVAVVCVPEKDIEATVEFGFADPRKTHHWRDYGRDVPRRLKAAGFHVETVTPTSCGDPAEWAGLAPGERVYLCRKG